MNERDNMKIHFVCDANENESVFLTCNIEMYFMY